MQKAGYLFIDNRQAPPEPGVPRFLEADTRTCGHCHAVVVMNPLRSRPRTFCKKCDHYVCDRCAPAVELLSECHDIERLIDKTFERAQHG